MLSCGEGGVRGGISSGLLGEEAATAEARDQLLAAEELLPWGCVEPRWGARRYDWLARLHGAAGSAALLGGPMHEFEAELRPWAAGQGWATRRPEWRRRVLALAQLPAEQQGAELLSLLRALLAALQPALSGEIAPPKERPLAFPPKQRTRGPAAGSARAAG